MRLYRDTRLGHLDKVGLHQVLFLLQVNRTCASLSAVIDSRCSRTNGCYCHDGTGGANGRRAHIYFTRFQFVSVVAVGLENKTKSVACYLMNNNFRESLATHMMKSVML